MRMFLQVMIFLLFIFLLNGCDSGWSIAGWEVK